MENNEFNSLYETTMDQYKNLSLKSLDSGYEYISNYKAISTSSRNVKKTKYFLFFNFYYKFYFYIFIYLCLEYYLR